MRFTMYPHTGLDGIPSSAEELHFSRPLSRKFVERVMARCPMLSRVTASSSSKKRMGKKVLELLNSKSVQIDIVQERGRAIEVPLEKITQAVEMRKDHRPYREIEKTTGIPKSTIHYLVKYSPRAKIKKDGRTILLNR